MRRQDGRGLGRDGSHQPLIARPRVAVLTAQNGTVESFFSMDDLNSKTGTEAGDKDDRRMHHNLRSIFDKACQITAPFFDSKQSWGGSSLTMYARQTLREEFPELTQQETAILFSAVLRFYRNPQKGSQE